MCFSATASFTLSGVLAGIGTVAVARTPSPAHRLFAGVPLLFAAQQASEGTVWLTFPPSHHELLHLVATLAFVSIAMVLWPTWIALALLFAERDRSRHRALIIFLIFGVLVSATSAVLLVRSPPVAVIAGHSIRYDSSPVGNAAVSVLLVLVYFVPTIGPFFVSTMRLSNIIGSTLVLSLVATLFVEREAFTSVWCFFAAILSVQTLVAVHLERVRGAGERRY